MNERFLTLCKVLGQSRNSLQEESKKQKERRTLILKEKLSKLDDEYCILNFHEACMKLHFDPAEVLQLRFNKSKTVKKMVKKVIQ